MIDRVTGFTRPNWCRGQLSEAAPTVQRVSTPRTRDAPRGRFFGLPVVIAIALAVILAGVLILIGAAQNVLRPYSAIKATLDQIGGLLVATGLLSILWEAFGKAAFTKEVLGYARVAQDVSDAGIKRVTMNYLSEVEWKDLFSSSRNLDIFVAYGRTWRHTHIDSLRKMARRSGTHIRIFLPDPDDPAHLGVMARRFNRSITALEADVREALREFSALSSEPGASIEVFVREGDWLFSCYKFDQRSVLVLYSHAQTRREVPTLILHEGDFAEFAAEEIDAILAQSSAVPIHLALQGKAR